jgi:hypothetical protein
LKKKIVGGRPFQVSLSATAKIKVFDGEKKVLLAKFALFFFLFLCGCCWLWGLQDIFFWKQEWAV